MKKLIGFIVLLSVCNGCSSNKKSVETPPNIIFFLIDDIGIISTPPYGGSGVKEGDHIIPLETPNIDTFATNAMTFTHVYATPSCAPSRAQLMTGQYPFQTEMVWPAYPSDHFLADSEVTIANILADQGYRTAFGGS